MNKKLYNANIKDFGHLNNKQIMSLTIYGESRGEPVDGKIGVGSVILNRVDHRKWDGETIQEVCLWPYQFSCYLTGDLNRESLFWIASDFESICRKAKSFLECFDTAKGMIDGVIPRNTTAMQYLNPIIAAKTKKKWLSAGMKVVMKIGNHEWFE